MKNDHLLNQVTKPLHDLFWRVDAIVPVDILPSTIRTEAQQLDYFTRGVSKTMNSKHLIKSGVRESSEAVDAGPLGFKWPQEFDFERLRVLPVEGWEREVKLWVANYWKDWATLYHFAGVVRAVAYDMRINIRYGGDWNGNFDLKDQLFFDAVHYEIKL